jgi:hypothetical protein
MLIADDSATVGQALRELFNRENDFDGGGEAENGQEVIERAK